MATAWQVYDSTLLKIGNGAINLSSDVLKCVLLSSASNAPSPGNSLYADLTNELATASGYTQGGNVLTNVTYTEASGVATLASDNATWTAAGGSLIARYAALYDDTATGKPLIAFSDAGQDITASDGNPFTVTMNASGILTVQRA